MDSVIAQLDKKYQNFSGNFADRAYNFSFDYAYSYLDILEQQPRIKEIIGKNKDNTQKYSLFFCYNELHRDIYLPMSKYKASALTPPNEIVGETQIYPHFRNMFTLKLAQFLIKTFPSLNRKDRDFDSYIAIQKIIYNIRQEKYKKYFDNLHQALIPLILSINDEKTENNKKETPVKSNLPLSFNSRTGDFVFYNAKGNLPIGGQEFKVFSTLYNAPDFQAEYLKLIQSYNPSVEVAHKAYRDDLFVIIRNLKERLNILPTTKTSNPDIFKNNKKIGYRLVFDPTDKNTE